MCRVWRRQQLRLRRTEKALELHSRRHLPLPRNVIGNRIKDTARYSRTIHAAVRLPQIRMVREVERLRAKLNLDPFRDPDGLKEGHIELHEMWSPKRIPSNVSLYAWLRSLPGTADGAIRV